MSGLSRQVVFHGSGLYRGFTVYMILRLQYQIWSLCSPQGQRTVYRLTLVKAWNTEELDAYADLINIGNPDFIEVKVSRSKVEGRGLDQQVIVKDSR